MEQVPPWLAAAITAAGVTTVYNADDWVRVSEATESPLTQPQAPAILPPSIN